MSRIPFPRYTANLGGVDIGNGAMTEDSAVGPTGSRPAARVLV